MEQIRAAYRPHFLTIKLPFPIKENLSEYSTEELSRLIHEYIHFLQNLHTPWGLYTGLRTYEEISYLFLDVNKTQETLYLPYEADYPESVIKNKVICNLGDGRRSIISDLKLDLDGLEFDSQVPFVLKEEFTSIGNKEYSTILIELETKLARRQHIELGAWIIKESMAQILQDKIFKPESSRNNILPYDFVKVYCEQNAPKIATDSKKILTICWASLFSMSPGKEFVKLAKFAEDNFKMTSEELFLYHITNSSIRVNNDRTLSFNQFMEEINEKYITVIETFLAMNCSYIRFILTQKDLIETHQILMSLYDNPNIQNIERIMEFMGEPAIFGEENTSCFTFLKGDESSKEPIFKLFNYGLINRFLLSKNVTCPNLDLCNQVDGFQKKYECVSNPLKIENECPMFYASRIVGIENRNIDLR